MSLAGGAVAAAGILATTGVVVSLWRGAERQVPTVRNAYRWFAAAAVLWCTSVIVGQAAAAGVGAGAMMLSFADLPALLVPPALAGGLAALAARTDGEGSQAQPRSSRRWQGSGLARLADGYVLASALFLIGWVTLFGPAFARAGEGPGTFAGELIHPLVDLAFMWVTLGVAAAAGRRGVLPYLALAVVTAADSLSVGARVSGTHPGSGALVAALAGLGLLALAPWGWRVWPSSPRGMAGPREVTTAMAAAVAAVAAAVIAVEATVSGGPLEPVVPLILATTVITLAVRVFGIVSKARSWAVVWQEPGRQFRQIADRTSDVVLLCDLDNGRIRYASQAVSDYGYSPEVLHGMPVADLLHPEDFSGGVRAVRGAVTGQGQRIGRYPCRVKAADGTWRYVESTVSRYHDPGVPDQLLITARDISAQVALRRQVTHLTFHDGLTGLPNRTYVEQRAHDVLSRAGTAARNGAQGAGEQPSAAGVIILDVDGFTTVNDAVGHHAADLLLAQIARRLRLAVSPQDTVARWGSDEFSVLVEETQSTEEIADIAERLARSLALVPFRVGDTDMTLTASVGVGLADGSPAGLVWRNAETAMSRAKEAGGNRVEVSGRRRAATGAGLSPASAPEPGAAVTEAGAVVSEPGTAVTEAGVAVTGPGVTVMDLGETSPGRLATGIGPARPGPAGSADGDSEAAAESPTPA